jgi:hypothetical protein
MFNNKIKSLLFVSALMLIFSCKKENENTTPTPSGNGSVEIEFDHRANGAALVLGNNYTNEKGETMNFSKFNYFVSNFSLVKEDGTIHTPPKDSCYFLIQEPTNGENPFVELKNIPSGDYKEIRFMIGIDSLKSTAPISERLGVLDPAGLGAGMYWAWNSGYIFVKAEGVSPQAPLDPGTNTNRFRYHIGLFGGFSTPTVNNIKKISLSDSNGDVATVRSNLTPHFHLKVDIMEMFKTPNTISIATNPTVMVTPFSANVAQNYVDMFKLDHIHN